MIKQILTAAKSTLSQPISQPAAEPAKPIPSPTPEPSPAPKPEAILKATPVSDQQFAETVAKQVGYRPGDQVTGAVLPKKIPNTRLLYVSVPDWSEPVICSVQNAADWSAGERIKCVYVKADTEGRLVFENRDGIRRNRWRR
jgi:hypothetical protein